MNPSGGELQSVTTGAQEEKGAGAQVLVSLVTVRRRCDAELRRGSAGCAAPYIGGEGASPRAEERQTQLGPADWGSGVLRSARAVELESCPGGPCKRCWACRTRTFLRRRRAETPPYISDPARSLEHRGKGNWTPGRGPL
ncbi:hypothetical protein NDU88_007944 [Pleurodeles waltl]|uniref:Uncharacterized protein n=1 Tax=Pleurodeles waltl TaxID=8319 RepID=A0AAV7PQG7_PLEWA|nr:hypothetical protein NDU88_007944 [Pleurodeles waltl]